MTFVQLAAQIKNISVRLNQLGYRRNDRLAVALPNGPEMLTTYLAVSSVCSCAPLNPAYQVDEFIFSLKDLRAKAVVIQREMSPLAREAAAHLGIPVLDLKPDENQAGLFEISSSLPENPRVLEPVLAEVDDIALLLHTSGTTSRPKIVPITHRNIFYGANNSVKSLKLTSADRCLNIMPLFNIHGLVAVALTSLSAGASIICTPGFSSYQIMDWFATLSPTWYSAVPSLHQAVVDQARFQPEKAKAAHLRIVRSASSPLSAQLACDLESAFDAPVLEALGMTEASGSITIVRLPPPIGKEGTVGVPQGSSKMCAMDEAGNILPAKIIGELCLSGENVVTGYENNPEANAATFMNGWMRTGDLGYIDEDGYVFIKGRIKEVINRGGAKVSPAEVDEVLMLHPAVKQVAAFGVPHPTLGEDVAAAIVLHDGMIVSMQELRQFAAANLADFKVPRLIVFVKEIPRNAVGKVQRIGLAEKLQPELAALRDGETGGGAEPITEVEAGILFIWQEVLGLKDVGIHDDYLVLGGDSIRAAIILMNVNERFGTDLLLGDIFDTPTIATMAGVVQKKLENSRSNLNLPPIQRRSQKETLLSPAQEALWFIQKVTPKSVAYNYGFLFKLLGGIDRKALERAVNELVQRHESLRTLYRNHEGKPYQVVLPFEPISLPVVDYSNMPLEEREAAIRRYAADRENEPFDLEKESAGRFAVLHSNPEEDYLYFCTHHINWDAWSHFVFTADLMRLYAACRSGEKPDLPELPIQYTDYALAHDEWLQGETRLAFLDHWKKALSGELPILELPTDRPRPAVQTDHGARYHFNLTPTLSHQIKEFSQRERITAFHMLLAAYGLLLGRYTGQEDILLGCPFANRPRAEQQSLIGLFTNVLPIRLNLGGGISVRELCQQARGAMLDAFTWQALPFKMLVNEIAPLRDLSRMPIYQVAINMMNVPHRPTSIPGLELSEVLRDEMPAQFEMVFEFTDEGEDFHASVIFNTDLFDKATIARMTSHFQNILGGMLAAPERPISEVKILSETERQHILFTWNNTAKNFPREKSVHRLFEEQAARTPDAQAVVFGDQRLSYAELNRKANQLAWHLNHLGVERGTFVGLCMERTQEMVIAMLAILKADSAYVPLDPTYPSERLAFMIQDSGLKIIVSMGNWVKKLPVEELKCLNIVLMDKQVEEITNCNPENLPLDTEPQEIAYIIYTSGSTGIPKGICIPHSAINNLVLNTNYINLTPEDQVAQASNMSFDAATFEVWGSLLNGACLVGVPQEVLLSPMEFAKVIRKQRINVLFLTTALFNLVASIEPTAFSPIRDLLFGGEAVSPHWVRIILKSGAPQRLLHVYGPTETTTYTTWYQVQDIAETDVNIPIGMPIANTTAYVLDHHLVPLPVGITGELYIGGDGLAVGYYKRPELTSERFIQNPFRRGEIKAGITSSERLYRTGDLVRRKVDGNIEFLGRMDNQVKLRGFRIELGEIESTLGQYPGVKQVVVVEREDLPGDKRLAAYIITNAAGDIVQVPGVAPDMNELRSFLREKLPDYMIPSAIILLEAFPLTANGKIDRKALPAPQMEALRNLEYAAPRSPTEECLSNIWMEVLGVNRVGADDDFFDLGGNSLSAVQVMVRVQHEFDLILPIHKIFKSPRLSDLAAQVDFELKEMKRQNENESNNREEFII